MYIIFTGKYIVINYLSGFRFKQSLVCIFSHNERDACKFFKFPQAENTRIQWKRLCRRDVKPGRGTSLCSCHFKDGKRENGPTIFAHNINKSFTFASPEKKKRKVTGTACIGEEVIETITSESSVAVETVSADDCEPSISNSQKSVASTSSTFAEPILTTTLAAENYFLQQEVSTAKAQLQHLSVQFSYQHVSDNDKLILLYTARRS
ncbi:hypothetical protein RN001_005784 [Aquatica leii]|uniref:THAP-type domain-containing protein n=1 Tax=Aquatica leii TaxID=1421715 RepID=A0AAN7SS47_9COLE|nr:hypothetical protein RN001_005784 [Aquatica leii]